MKLCNYTLPEINYLISMSNFTEDEKKLFNLRIKDIPLEKCAEIMNVSISTVNRISKKINEKIMRVI